MYQKSCVTHLFILEIRRFVSHSFIKSNIKALVSHVDLQHNSEKVNETKAIFSFYLSCISYYSVIVKMRIHHLFIHPHSSYMFLASVIYLSTYRIYQFFSVSYIASFIKSSQISLFLSARNEIFLNFNCQSI